MTDEQIAGSGLLECIDDAYLARGDWMPLVQAFADAVRAAERERWRALAQRLAHEGNARGLEGLQVRCTVSESGSVVSWEVVSCAAPPATAA